MLIGIRQGCKMSDSTPSYPECSPTDTANRGQTTFYIFSSTEEKTICLETKCYNEK